MRRTWNITLQRRIFFFFSLPNPFATLPLFTKLCSGSHKMYQTLSGSNYLFKECIKTCFKEMPFFFPRWKNINKKLNHSLTSCVRKLNQNKTENPMIKSKGKKTTAADFCKSVFLCTHKLLNYWEGKQKYPTNPRENGFHGGRGNEGCH